MTISSDRQVTTYFSAANYSRAISGNDHKAEASNIEEAESSLQENVSLNSEEARAVLGRYEYQKGNIDVALRVYEGIDIAAATTKLKISLSEIAYPQRHSHFYAAPPFSLNTVGLLLETAYLKSRTLQHFGRYKEAAESCIVILDVIESSLPKGLPETLDTDHKLQETLSNAVEFLPYLFQLANLPQEANFSFKRALLHDWNLNKETIAKIQKEYVVFLLYSGGEEANNIEEAILLLMNLLRIVSLKEIEWDPSILDHLSYALSIYGGLEYFGKQLEDLLPTVIENNERSLLLALCFYGQGDNISALDVLKFIYENDHQNCGLALLIASKIYGDGFNYKEGISTANRAIQVYKNKCDEMVGVAYSFLGVSLSANSRLAVTDSERVNKQCEALESLKTAGRLTKMVDSRILYELALEMAEQRMLDDALGYVTRLINLEGGSHLKGWMLLARILSALKRFKDGEDIIDAALDQTVKWDRCELLWTKAKLQLAQGQVKRATQTYIQLLAVLQVQSRKHLEVGENRHKRLELEIWNGLAKVYISLSRWDDAEACLLKSKAITNYSASTRHATGLLYEAKGEHKQALKAYKHALDADPVHVESLISIAGVFRRLGGQSGPVARSFLNEALRIDRMNSSAWYNLGKLLRDEGSMYLSEAADCFQAASVLMETEPIEPFR
ncbi:NPGR2-like protein [Tanacetum coccineum]